MSDRTPGGGSGSETLAKLIAVGQDLAGACHTATVAEVVARALNQLLTPDGYVILLLEGDKNIRRIADSHNYANDRSDDPLLDLALKSPLVLERKSLANYSLDPLAASWMGAPIPGTAGQPIGAAALWSKHPNHFQAEDVTVLHAILTSAGIALQNSRLLQVLSVGKRQWEQALDAIGEAFCVVDDAGIMRRGNRAFATLAQRPVTALNGEWDPLESTCRHASLSIL